MIVSYYGDGGFRLQSGDFSLLVDPPNARLKSDMVLKTLVSTGIHSVPLGEIAFPGEYEVKGIGVLGWPVQEELTDKFMKTVYLVKWDGMFFAFLGHIKNMPSTEILGNLNDPNILFLPIGGGHFLSASEAVKVVKKLEPNLAVPSFYKEPDEFLKAIGQKVKPEEKLVFKKKDLVEERGRVVVLEKH